MHICVIKLNFSGSDNGLSPGRRQAIIRTNAGMLLIGPLGTNFSEILIKIHTFLLKKMHLKMSSGKWRPFCLCLNVLIPGGSVMACVVISIPGILLVICVWNIHLDLIQGSNNLVWNMSMQRSSLQLIFYVWCSWMIDIDSSRRLKVPDEYLTVHTSCTHCLIDSEMATSWLTL